MKTRRGHAFKFAIFALATRLSVTSKGVEDRQRVEQLIPFAIYLQTPGFCNPLLEGEVYTWPTCVGLAGAGRFRGREVGAVLRHVYDNGAQAVFTGAVGASGRQDIPFAPSLRLVAYEPAQGNWIQLVAYPEYLDSGMKTKTKTINDQWGGR